MWACVNVGKLKFVALRESSEHEPIPSTVSVSIRVRG